MPSIVQDFLSLNTALSEESNDTYQVSEYFVLVGVPIARSGVWVEEAIGLSWLNVATVRPVTIVKAERFPSPIGLHSRVNKLSDYLLGFECWSGHFPS